ncbi:MAG TPA: 50S ribosomal protein L25 [Bacillota bacterium]|nr:50S ribosomal protein L25 [Bacillota bacterium]
MAEWNLTGSPRASGHPQRARHEGQVPAVLYGRGVASESLAIDRHALLTLLQRGGAHHVIRLKVASGQALPAMIKEIQWHPVDGTLVHVDFHAVSMSESIHAEVPLRITGDAEVHKKGAIIEQERHELAVSCLPDDLPETITVDVSGLAVGESLTVGDLPLPKGVRALDAASDLVVSVVLPRAAEEPAAAEPAAGATAGEPEVVARRAKSEAEREG